MFENPTYSACTWEVIQTAYHYFILQCTNPHISYVFLHATVLLSFLHASGSLFKRLRT